MSVIIHHDPGVGASAKLPDYHTDIVALSQEDVGKENGMVSLVSCFGSPGGFWELNEGSGRSHPETTECLKPERYQCVVLGSTACERGGS